MNIKIEGNIVCKNERKANAERQVTPFTGHNHGIFWKKKKILSICHRKSEKFDLSKVYVLARIVFLFTNVCLLSGPKQQRKTQYKHQHTKNKRDLIQCKPLSS